MEPDFNLCDCCGAQTPKNQRIFIATAPGGPCPSGNGSLPDEGKCSDLCGLCACAIVKKLLDTVNSDGHRIDADFARGVRVLRMIQARAALVSKRAKGK